jgi:hypothetical protein
MTFFHSESGNSGQSGELVSDRLVDFGSTVYASMSSSVLARLSESAVSFPVFVPNHANADSLTLSFLVTGSSSDCPLSTSGVGEREAIPHSPPLAPRLAAIADSES